MSTYQFVLFAHIASAMILVGSTFLATPAVHRGLRRSQSIGEIRLWLIAGKPLRVIDPLSAIVLLASGLYMSNAIGWWRFGWARTAIFLWLVDTALAAAVVGPRTERLAKLAFSTEDSRIGPELDLARRDRALRASHDAIIANDLAVLFLMVVKPLGLITPILTVLGAHAVILTARGIPAIRWSKGRQSSRTAPTSVPAVADASST